jgi:hypothetical protein
VTMKGSLSVPLPFRRKSRSLSCIWREKDQKPWKRSSLRQLLIVKI